MSITMDCGWKNCWMLQLDCAQKATGVPKVLVSSVVLLVWDESDDGTLGRCHRLNISARETFGYFKTH